MSDQRRGVLALLGGPAKLDFKSLLTAVQS